MDNQLEPRKTKLNYKKLRKLPINLRKKVLREARNSMGMQSQQRRKRTAKQVQTKSRIQNDFACAEHNAMLVATAEELQQILADYEELADVPCDATPVELLGQIASAERCGTTINVQRDGLSTLKIVLHQRAPTIAQLKKAIAIISCAKQKRRRAAQRRVWAESKNEDNKSTVARTEDTICSSSELVNSAQFNGHEHRALVSWRFLWRCFALFNVDTSQPIDDNAANGRATLTELGIKNGANLKFVHRIKYFGRRRQS